MNEGQQLRVAQMTDGELQRDPSPEAAAEIKRRNDARTVPTGMMAWANSALNRLL